ALGVACLGIRLVFWVTALSTMVHTGSACLLGSLTDFFLSRLAFLGLVSWRECLSVSLVGSSAILTSVGFSFLMSVVTSSPLGSPVVFCASIWAIFQDSSEAFCLLLLISLLTGLFMH